MELQNFINFNFVDHSKSLTTVVRCTIEYFLPSLYRRCCVQFKTPGGCLLWIYWTVLRLQTPSVSITDWSDSFKIPIFGSDLPKPYRIHICRNNSPDWYNLGLPDYRKFLIRVYPGGPSRFYGGSPKRLPLLSRYPCRFLHCDRCGLLKTAIKGHLQRYSLNLFMGYSTTRTLTCR